MSKNISQHLNDYVFIVYQGDTKIQLTKSLTKKQAESDRYYDTRYIVTSEETGDVLDAGLNLAIDIDETFKQTGIQLLCVDCDTDEAHTKAQEYGLPETYTEQSMKGYHYWYVIPDEQRQNIRLLPNSNAAPKLEVFTSKNVLIAPSRVNGVRYKVISDVPVATVPQWALDCVTGTHKGKTQEQPISLDKKTKNSFWSAVAAEHELTGFNSDPKRDMETAERLLPYISSDDYHQWIKVGFALVNVFETDLERGYEVFDRWSQDYNDYNPIEVQKKWDSLVNAPKSDEQASIATIIYLAREESDNDSEVETIIRSGNTENDCIEEPEDKEMRVNEMKEDMQNKGIIKGFVPLSELCEMDIPDMSFAVNGLIPEGVTLLSGDAKIGKTNAALDIAIQVATGYDKVFGEYSTNKGDVLYLDLENGQKRIQKRAQKICKAHNITAPNNLYVLDFKSDISI